ncbi:MAG: in like serine protease [Bacillales bacterium]|nr:in like serine protease [Bacillales bacterium]
MKKRVIIKRVFIRTLLLTMLFSYTNPFIEDKFYKNAKALAYSSTTPTSIHKSTPTTIPNQNPNSNPNSQEKVLSELKENIKKEGSLDKVCSMDTILISFKPDVTRSQIKEFSMKHNLTFDGDAFVKNSYTFKLSDQMISTNLIEELGKQNIIDIVEPDYKSTITVEPNYNLLWGLKNANYGIDINVESAWTKTKGDGVIVAVIDTGIDWSHPDLSDRVWVNNSDPIDGIDNDGNGLIDDYRGWDFANNDNNPSDDNGHGTHVSGTIGASENGIGVVGVAPNVKIMPLKAFGSNGSGYNSDIIKAINYAQQKGAMVVNMSYGSPFYSSSEYSAMQQASSTVFVAAAGNESTNNDSTPSYPANYQLSNKITVASIRPDGLISYFSNYGISTVDVAAPGSSILSTIPNSQYGYADGTSMAAPHVSGVAALVKSKNFNMIPSEIKNAITSSVTKISGLSTYVKYGGIVNAGASVSVENDNTGNSFSLAPLKSLTQGSTYTLTANMDYLDDVDFIKIVAPLTGIYKFYSTESNANLQGTLYNQAFVQLASNDNLTSNNFDFQYTLMQGETYYFKINQNSPTSVGSYQFNIDIPQDDSLYNVQFNSLGGSTVGPIAIRANQLLIEPATPTRLNYIFEGWYKESSCVNKWNFESDRVTNDITLFAKWKFKTDYTLPVISGATSKTIALNAPFDPLAGVIATDNVDGIITNKIVVTGTVNSNVKGVYQLTYSVSDNSGNVRTVSRTITVDNTLPIINGATSKMIPLNVPFDPLAGVTATDNLDGNITNKIVVTGTVNVNVRGVYQLTYTVSDNSGNVRTVSRTITVDITLPIINGATNKTIALNAPFDPLAGVTATDNLDGNITNKIVVSGTVNVNVKGVYTLTYTVSDNSGNVRTVSRTITVDNTLPIINGATSKTIALNAPFDPLAGVTATDNLDGNITNKIVVTGTVNVNVKGVYQLTYTVSDNSGNVRIASRTITIDNTKPVISGATSKTIALNAPFDPYSGVTATDNLDGNITYKIVVTGTVNVNVKGVYQLTYTVSDSSGNVGTVSRTITIDNTMPVISGATSKTIALNAPFDPYVGVTATDNVDGNITYKIVVTGTVNVNVKGVYQLTYTVSDNSGNVRTTSRTIELCQERSL